MAFFLFFIVLFVIIPVAIATWGRYDARHTSSIPDFNMTIIIHILVGSTIVMVAFITGLLI